MINQPLDHIFTLPSNSALGNTDTKPQPLLAKNEYSLYYPRGPGYNDSTAIRHVPMTTTGTMISCNIAASSIDSPYFRFLKFYIR